MESVPARHHVVGLRSVLSAGVIVGLPSQWSPHSSRLRRPRQMLSVRPTKSRGAKHVGQYLNTYLNPSRQVTKLGLFKLARICVPGGLGISTRYSFSFPSSPISIERLQICSSPTILGMVRCHRSGEYISESSRRQRKSVNTTFRCSRRNFSQCEAIGSG